MTPPPRGRELGPAIEGKRREWRPGAPGGVGTVCCYVAERCAGRPLVLVHDLRPTSSAYEMRPLFEACRWTRPAFAIDLPGFGLSERSVWSCSLAVLSAVLAELCRKVRRADLAPDVVALGRGSEVAAQVAREDPGLLRSLVMLEPAGLLSTTDRGFERWAARIASLLGERGAHAALALMASRPIVRHALSARFYGPPDEGLLDYARASASAPGAHWASMAALAARRWTPELSLLFHQLTVPVLVVHDAHGAQSIELEAFLRGRANRFAVRMALTRGMPQFERRLDTIETLVRFWQSLPRAARDRAIR